MLYAIIVLIAVPFGMAIALNNKPTCSFGELMTGGLLTGVGALYGVLFILELTGGAA